MYCQVSSHSNHRFSFYEHCIVSPLSLRSLQSEEFSGARMRLAFRLCSDDEQLPLHPTQLRYRWRRQNIAVPDSDSIWRWWRGKSIYGSPRVNNDTCGWLIAGRSATRNSSLSTLDQHSRRLTNNMQRQTITAV